MVHHQCDNEGYKLAEKSGAIAQLLSIDAAIPGSAAMDQLIAQGVHAGQNNRENGHGAMSAQRLMNCHLGAFKF